MAEILLAIRWMEDSRPMNVLICSDSYSALSSLISGRSSVLNYFKYVQCKYIGKQDMFLVGSSTCIGSSWKRGSG